METTHRFSDRVEFYLRYRPRYPLAIVTRLADAVGLTPDWTVADVGSGTGFLARVFLENGNTVHGIEPNRNMREAGESFLAAYPAFHSRDGSAEHTGLPDASVELVSAGQAFHWFDAGAARAEFRRILRPGGIALIAWNERNEQGSVFMAEYDALLHRHAPEYRKVGHRTVEEAAYARFFGRDGYRAAAFPNEQRFDREGLRGRLRSSSYTPPPGDPGHGPMMEELDALFERHQRDGRVAFDYTTRIFFGRL